MELVHCTIRLVFVAATLYFSTTRAQDRLAPAILVFGDSTVDAGNNNFLETIVKANFRPYGRDFDTRKPTGRFCNGRTPVDHLASMINLPLAPAYLDPEAEGSKIVTGVNFATSASGFYEKTAVTFNVPGLVGQLAWFREYKNKLVKIVGQKNATDIISQALFAISTGSNDYVNNYYINPILQKEFDRNTYRGILIDAFEDFSKALYDLGARRIAVVSLSPMGCIPSQVTIFGEGSLDCVQFGNEDAILFNRALNASVVSLREKLSGLKFAYIDIYSILDSNIRNPSMNGFEKTTTGCCGVGRLAVSILCNEHTVGTCTDATKYIFWDSFHPTDKMNKLIAEAALSQGLPQLF